MSLWQPIIKRIWTASMTIYSAGWCYLLLTLFYWLIDVKEHRKGWEWLLYYGCNAITAYLIGEIINFRGIVHSLLYGTEQYLGDWYPVVQTACNSLIIFFILKIMYKNKILLKV
jgi:predicted acyltransferase